LDQQKAGGASGGLAPRGYYRPAPVVPLVVVSVLAEPSLMVPLPVRLRERRAVLVRDLVALWPPMVDEPLALWSEPLPDPIAPVFWLEPMDEFPEALPIELPADWAIAGAAASKNPAAAKTKVRVRISRLLCWEAQLTQPERASFP
jgi:hypothetical protein